MTKNEFMEKHKDVEFTFSRYYKYSFTFEGVTEDGKNIRVTCGDGTDSIYRFEVVAGAVEYIHCLDPRDGEVYVGDMVVESFYGQW